MKKRISISEIASKLHVSPTTVSFVLNNRYKEKRVSAAMVKKIKDYVTKIGYQPNAFARGLRTGKSNIIGLMVEDISNPFFSTIAKLIEDQAYAAGYRIMYCSTLNDPEKAKDLIRMFKDCNVDGYIIAPTDGMEDEIKQLIEEKEKVVLFDRYLNGFQTDYVGINNSESASSATKLFINAGYEHIGFVTTTSKQSQMRDRLQGYSKTLKKLKRPTCIQKIPFTEDVISIQKRIEKFIIENQQLDAILFATNYLGIQGIDVIKKIGYKIPKDIGIISFDDHVAFQLHHPAITSIIQPVEAIAETIIQHLLKKLEYPKTPLLTRELPTRIQVRASSK